MGKPPICLFRLIVVTHFVSNRYLWTREKWEEQQALIESEKLDDVSYISVELPEIPDRELGEFKRFLDEQG